MGCSQTSAQVAEPPSKKLTKSKSLVKSPTTNKKPELSSSVLSPKKESKQLAASPSK